MSILTSSLRTDSEEFRQRYTYNKRLVAELHERQTAARTQRPGKDLARLASLGKMTVRQRLDKLLDAATPFLELSTLAGCTKEDRESPGASCVTGVGIVSGREVMIHAADPTVKGGAWYPLTVKKILRALDIALENNLPVVHLCDSAGGFLPLQSEIFPDREMAGRIFRNQALLSQRGLKQLSLVFGHCTAGGAYVPAMSDYSVIVRGTGAVFLGGPPLVKAATGEIVTADELGGADLHTQISGTCDYPAANEDEAIAIGREIVSQWRDLHAENGRRIQGALATSIEAPLYDPDELYGVLPDDIKKSFDMREVIARLVDGSRFHEYQPAYGKTLVCGFAEIWGQQVGILGNNGVLFNDSTLKGAHFIELCNQNETPMLFLQNITGYMVGRDYEAAGITKDGAKMIMAQAGSRVAKITVMCHASFGAGNYGMCGRAYDGRFLFTWPNHQIGVMGGEQAARTMADIKVSQQIREGKMVDDALVASIRETTLRGFETQMSAYHSTSEIWDDGILDPAKTRDALGVAFAVARRRPIDTTKQGYGVFRL